MNRKRFLGSIGSSMWAWLADPPHLQALAAVLQFFAAVALLIVTLRYVQLSDHLLRAQIEAHADLEIDANSQLVVQNTSAYPIVGVGVSFDVYIIDLKQSTPVEALHRATTTSNKQGGMWWPIGTLQPGETRWKSPDDAGAKTLDFLKSGVADRQKDTSRESGTLLPVTVFRLVFHREIDHKRYRRTKKLLVVRDSSGKFTYTDLDLGQSFEMISNALKKIPE